jgi:hypothetical protein
MSARVPHLLTRLKTESELDALNKELQDRAVQSSDDAVFRTWMDAAILIEKHRNSSLARRSNQTPSARRKSLGYRTQITGYRDCGSGQDYGICKVCGQGHGHILMQNALSH